MSGMDNVSDQNLKLYADHCGGDMQRMARELLAHRRASQAAPSEAHVCELNRAMNGECMQCGSIDQGMAEQQRQADLRHAQPAHTPSDGLREAVETIVNTHGFLTDLGYILGKQNGNYRRAWASAVVRREMVKLAKQYADDGLSASPAQEGERT